MNWWFAYKFIGSFLYIWFSDMFFHKGRCKLTITLHEPKFLLNQRKSTGYELFPTITREIVLPLKLVK